MAVQKYADKALQLNVLGVLLVRSICIPGTFFASNIIMIVSQVRSITHRTCAAGVLSRVFHVSAAWGIRVTPVDGLGATLCLGVADLVAAETPSTRVVRVGCHIGAARLPILPGYDPTLDKKTTLLSLNGVPRSAALACRGFRPPRPLSAAKAIDTGRSAVLLLIVDSTTTITITTRGFLGLVLAHTRPSCLIMAQALPRPSSVMASTARTCGQQSTTVPPHAASLLW